MNEAAVTFETYKSRNPEVNRQQCFRTPGGMNWTANRGSRREIWEGESPGESWQRGSAASGQRRSTKSHIHMLLYRAGGPTARGLSM